MASQPLHSYLHVLLLLKNLLEDDDTSENLEGKQEVPLFPFYGGSTTCCLSHRSSRNKRCFIRMSWFCVWFNISRNLTSPLHVAVDQNQNVIRTGLVDFLPGKVLSFKHSSE